MNKISVLMPVYNSAKYLEEALRNILDQSFKDFELVVIDDGSTDGSRKIIQKFEKQDERVILVICSKNVGITKALNNGLGHCKGKYVARADADDLYDKDRLKIQYEFMEGNYDVALCGSLGWYIDKSGNRVGEKNLPLKYSEIKKKLLFNNQFIHSSLFIRKFFLEKEGFYDERFQASQDYELILRLARKYRVVNLKDRLVSWRVNSGSVSWASKRQEWDAIRARFKAIKKYDYPYFEGLINIFLRFCWFVIPQKLKAKRYAH